MKLPPFAVAAFLLALAGCSAPPDAIEPVPRSVEVFQVDAGAPSSEPVYAGTLRARQRSELSFLQTGQIREMSKDLGEHFLRGEVLARLDSNELELSRLDAEGQMAEAATRADESLRACCSSRRRCMASLEPTRPVMRAAAASLSCVALSVAAASARARWSPMSSAAGG